MIFKKPRVRSETWNYEFIRVTYSGLLKSYCISGNGFSENHEFSFGNFYGNGVNSVSYSEKHNFFFVAGNSVSQNLSVSPQNLQLILIFSYYLLFYCFSKINYNYAHYYLKIMQLLK